MTAALQTVPTDATDISLFRELARSEAKTGRSPDKADLRQAIFESGRSIEDYNTLVEAYRKLPALRRQAAGVSAAGKDLSAARERERKAKSKMEKVTREIYAEMMEAQRDAQNAAHAIGICEAADEEANGIEIEHAKLLGVEVPDLDAFRLATRGGPINICDDAAPTKLVPQSILNREDRRRRAIMTEAVRKAQEGHASAMAHWKAASPRDYEGNIPDRYPAPKLVLPTWGDLMKAGIPAKYPRKEA